MLHISIHSNGEIKERMPSRGKVNQNNACDQNNTCEAP